MTARELCLSGKTVDEVREAAHNINLGSEELNVLKQEIASLLSKRQNELGALLEADGGREVTQAAQEARLLKAAYDCL